MGRQRTRVGLIFSNNPNWIGGSYYIINLIRTMELLPDAKMPVLVIFSNHNDFNFLKNQIIYPYLEFVDSNNNPSNYLAIFLNRITLKLFKFKIMTKFYRGYVDVLFPFNDNVFFKKCNEIRKIYWIPDFQEKYLTNLFDVEEIKRREVRQLKITSSINDLVLSSNSAFKDLKIYYPNYLSKVSILKFAVALPHYNLKSIDELCEKYNISQTYFFCSNQFWVHKNHFIILKAILELKIQGVELMVVFSGNPNDYRNPNYFGELNDFVKNNGLEQNVRILGFIDRVDQIGLMKYASAIIQPSLFEGWSTVIEDAKALGKLVIASDIDVHREQLGNYGKYFEKNNYFELSDLLINFKSNNRAVDYEYKYEIERYMDNLLTLFDISK
jgi:hypothetical protein